MVIRSIVGDSYLLYNHVTNGSKKIAIDLLPSISSRAKEPPAQGDLGMVGKMTDEQLVGMRSAILAEVAKRKRASKENNNDAKPI